jgi:predicted enzyme related to lactoylglutathione lyase
VSTGYFVWHDLFTTDAEAASTFYQQLLEWTVEVRDMGTGPYTMFKVGDTYVGGISPAPPHGGMPSSWVSYISVDDLGKAVEQIKANGGAITGEPFTVPGVGTMAYATDPEGAMFSPFQDDNPDNQPELPQGVQPGGSVAWHELTTDDQDKADDFYSAIFGWNKVVWPMEGGEDDYHGLCVGETPVAGVFKRPPGAPAGVWTIYFEVPGTIDQAEADVRALGGTVLKSKFSVEGTGEFVVASDPTGAVIGLIKSTPM